MQLHHNSKSEVMNQHTFTVHRCYTKLCTWSACNHCLKFELINKSLDCQIAWFGQVVRIVYSACVTCPFGSFAENLLYFLHGPTWHRPCQSLCWGHSGYFFDHKLASEPTGTKNDDVIPLGRHHQQSPCTLKLMSFARVWWWSKYVLNFCVVCTVNCLSVRK